MVKVYGVKPASGGFGMFQLDVDGQIFDGLDSVDDYVGHVEQENRRLERDEEAAMEADGRTYDQGKGKIVGWRDPVRGNVYLECVFVINEAAK
ncbi:MAG: hypothetical protein KGL39_00570 [Patescibacteria group bacterium]|nr:hypothetical protein [Patescibacteria group bacterium]